MVGWHHRLDGHGFGWTLGTGDGHGGLMCCGSWGTQRVGHKRVIELTTEHEMVKVRDAWRATVHGITKNWTQLSE